MPETGVDKYDGTSSEEESDGEIVVTTRRKSFGIRVAQTPQQAQQQVLSQIGSLANERQANEIVVQETQSVDKSETERKALEQRQKMIEAQQLAKAQQAAALQAAAARVAQAQSQAQANQTTISNVEKEQQGAALKAAQDQAKKAQQDALARAQEAQKKAQEEAQKKTEAAQKQAQAQALAQQKAQQEAFLKAQASQKQAQEEALKRAQKMQADAQLRSQQEAQKQAILVQQKQQQQHSAQQQAQNQQKGREEIPKKSNQALLASGQTPTQKKVPASQEPIPVQSGQVSNQPMINSKGSLSHAQPASQEIHSATGPKWSRTPGKVQTQGPQPEQQKHGIAVAPPTGKTALRQTAQVQEQELSIGTNSTLSPVVARKPQIQADQLVQKFVEKPEEQKEKIIVQKGLQLDGAKRWVADSEIREQPAINMQPTERGPKAVILADDACWQTQRRVPLEIQQPQIGKITIPELSEKDIQRTIVAQPASYHKIQWNEFPEEPKYEISAAPKAKTQDWVPVNNEQNELQRNIYKPARMSAIWPPPQDEIIKEGHSPLVVKANEDTTWIQQDQNGVLKQAVWGKASRVNRVWPPPENESSLSDFGPQHMPVVQWPPPEAEAHEREQVEVLQKHIPTKKMERQWPPPPPQYQVVESTGEIETRYNPSEVTGEQQNPNGHQEQQVIRTVIRSQ